MPRSNLPLTLALVTFALALLSGGSLYNRWLKSVPALVAVQDLSAGVELTPSMVTVIRVPAGGRPPQGLFGVGQIVGQYSAIPLFADHIITQRHLTAKDSKSDGLFEPMPGQRVISLPVRSEAALGGALRPGDVVDVVTAWPGQEGKPGAVDVAATGVRIVDLRNVAGVSIGQSSSASYDGLHESLVPATVLVQVSSHQGRQLVAAVEGRAVIYLWLIARGELP